MSIEAFTWVMGIVFGWALHATLVHERIGHVVLAMTAIAVAAHRLEMDDAGTVSAAKVFLIGGISFLVMTVASRLWAEAIEAYWRDGAQRMADEDIEGVITLGMRGNGDTSRTGRPFRYSATFIPAGWSRAGLCARGRRQALLHFPCSPGHFPAARLGRAKPSV